MIQVKDKKILVIGLGASGLAAARFLIDSQAHVFAVDKNKALFDSEAVAGLRKKGLHVLLESDPFDIRFFDLCIVSPGVPQTQPHFAAACHSGIEVIGEIELACRFLKNPCIGITGTNGKTTVTLLITHVLNHAGKKARALGNVGTPLIQEVMESSNPDEIFVIELSSFQLETMSAKVLDHAAILNITPDHLDRYASMEAYAQAKIRIADCLKKDGRLYVENACYEQYMACFEDKVVDVYGYQPLCAIYTDLQKIFTKEKFEYILPPEYRGRRNHDIENMMAALALCMKFGVGIEQFFEGVKSFKKPSHRIEFVRKIHEVAYYDDSKGTNVDAVMRAVNSIDGRLILIAGGVDKGSSYMPWLDVFDGKVKLICAIGQAAEKIKRELSSKVPVEIFKSLDDAVKHAASLANSGESVLLSPGCSSFDMFRDYAHRGDEFKKIVNLLGGEAK